MKATREQMALLVMEILYVWTIISGCSEVDIQQMLDGLSALLLPTNYSVTAIDDAIVFFYYLMILFLVLV